MRSTPISAVEVEVNDADWVLSITCIPWTMSGDLGQGGERGPLAARSGLDRSRTRQRHPTRTVGAHLSIKNSWKSLAVGDFAPKVRCA